MIFRCKVCAEKDNRIRDLKDQVAHLRGLVFPNNSPESTPDLILEADGVLSGQQHVFTIPETVADAAELRRVEEEESERDRVLAGNY